MAAKQITATLVLDKETKNTGKYVEQDADGNTAETPAIGTIYVPKASLGQIAASKSNLPAEIEVTITAA